MADNIAWLESKIKKASEEGNYEDWKNYTEMLKTEKARE